MYSKKKNARTAGLMYLIMAITGGFGIMYVPVNIIVAGDISATARNMMDSEFLVRVSVFSNLISQTIFIFLALSLNRLFKEVNANYARLLLTLVVIAVPISFLNSLNLVAAQILVSGSDYLNIFDSGQRNALMMFFINMYEQGIIIVEIFWGLWLLPFGLLVIKSKFIPKIIGVFLVIGCFSYLLESFTGFFLPDYSEIVSPYLMLPLIIGEFSIIFWFLIKGVRTIS